LGQSHGVLDLGTRVGMFQGPILTEVSANAGRKTVVLYEDAGGLGRNDAKLIARKSLVVRSVAEAFLGFRLAIPELDATMINSLGQGPLAEHGHYAMSLLFFDWLLSKCGHIKNVDFMPEHSCNETDLRHEKVHEKIKPLVVAGVSLDEVIRQMSIIEAELRSFATNRDKSIAESLEKIFEVNKGVRLKIVIVIGADHKDIERQLSLGLSSKVKFRTENGPNAADVTAESVDTDLCALSRTSAARHILLSILARTLKGIFLKKHADILLKSPGQLDDGKNVFERLQQVVSTFPNDAIYMLLQEWGGIDCGLAPDSYPDFVFSDPFNIDLNVTLGNLERLVDDAGVIDMSSSDIGLFIDKRFVCYSLYRMLNVDDLATRLIIEAWIMSEVKGDMVQVLKTELLDYFRFGSRIPCPHLQSLVENLNIGKPNGISHGAYITLQNLFSRTR
jgi:hypothetical protein